MIHVRQRCSGLLVAILTATTASAQGATPPPGRAVSYLAQIDFAATPVGDFPSNISMVDGVMDVVTMNGQRMLRASAASAFLIRLPQALPVDFTIEADVIPKVDANPADIGFEGTPTINQGSSSANILWHSQSLQVVGGAVDNFETRFPDAVATATAGVLTRVTVVVQGPTIRVFTNGRLMSTLPSRSFVRGPVLRVYLGGQDDGTQAVYLAALRIIPGALSATQLASASAPVPPAPGSAVAPNAQATGGGATASAPTGAGSASGGTSGSSTTAATAITTVAPTAATGMTTSGTSGTSTTSNTATASGRYRVTMTGVQVKRPTIDDLLDRDGKADEIYASTVVVRWDRKAGQTAGPTTIVKSREYGDVGNGQTWPYRIRAGTAQPSGGITTGNAVPIGFNPSSPSGAPGADTFPFILWEGTLSSGGEAIVLFPSLWERDIDDVVYKGYTGNWMNNTAPVLQSQLLLNQYASTSLMPITGPTDIGTFGQAAAGPVFTQPIYGVYAIPLMSLGNPVDRLIGMMTVAGALAYPERILVVTREKLANLQVGGHTDLQIPLIELAIGTDGIYTMFLRIERLP